MTTNTLDKEIDKLISDHAYEVYLTKDLPDKEQDKEQLRLHKIYTEELKSLIADREKKMLEFVIGPDREVKGNYDYQINEEKAEQRQRAKEWRER